MKTDVKPNANPNTHIDPSMHELQNERDGLGLLLLQHVHVNPANSAKPSLFARPQILF